MESRNEARVHLWYEQRFGVPCEPHDCTEAAIDSFAATTCCLGIRRTGSGDWRVYEAKVRQWREQWPELTVLPWPADSRADAV